jgi:hypothetical protein
MAQDATPRITALLDATIRYETTRIVPLIEQMTRHLSEDRHYRWRKRHDVLVSNGPVTRQPAPRAKPAG